MKRGLHRAGWTGLLLAALGAAILLPLSLGGCGEKIAIPQSNTIWANLAYSLEDSFAVPGVRQLVASWGNVFVLTSDEISKRNLSFEPDTAVALSGDPTSLCVDETGSLVFVWEQATQTVQVFDSTELEPLGSAYLPEIRSVISMTTSPTGIDAQVEGGRTFLYLSDPVSGVIHRYAVMGVPGSGFTCSECMLPMGVLAWPVGGGARSVHVPGGLETDGSDALLVCERDPERNWVIRFDGTPDEEDTTPIDLDEETSFAAWAGKAIVFDQPTCAPEPAAADYVLGYAALCDQEDWVGGPRTGDGEFDDPLALAIDGEGKIYVADHGNSRVQIFDELGVYQAQFQVRGTYTHPTSLGVVDVLGQDGSMHYAAFVFVIAETSNQVVKLISSEHYLDENGELPPYEE